MFDVEKSADPPQPFRRTAAESNSVIMVHDTPKRAYFNASDQQAGQQRRRFQARILA